MGASLSYDLPSNPNAKHIVLIEYCGVRSYESEAFQMYKKLNQTFPELFQFEIKRDHGFTDRLECTIKFDIGKPKKKRDAVIFSRARCQGHVNYNWSAFIDRTKEALYHSQFI